MKANIMTDDAKQHPVDMDLKIECASWMRHMANLHIDLQCALNMAAKKTKAGKVSILLTHSDQMQALNKAWRGLDKPTDILSFPAEGIYAPFWGDIAIGFENFKDRALKYGKPLNAHLSHLIIHGYLHLIGYNHQTDDEIKMMEALEIDILSQLGISNPYLSGPRLVV